MAGPDLIAMLLEAIDCLGTSEEGMERERELSDQFDALIGNYAAGDRAERLRALLVALRDVPSKAESIEEYARTNPRASMAQLLGIFFPDKPTQDDDLDDATGALGYVVHRKVENRP